MAAVESSAVSEKDTCFMEDRKRSDIYRIRVKGHLDSSWSEWFEGLTIANEVNGTTALTGTVADQAALHGLIAKVRDLGLPLLLVERVEIRTSARGSSSAAQSEPNESLLLSTNDALVSDMKY